MVSWLVCSTPERAVRVRALAGDIVLYSDTLLRQYLSTQVYKWASENLMLGGNPVMDWHPMQERVEYFMLLKPQTSSGLMCHLARL